MPEMDVKEAAAHWRRAQVEPELAALGFSPTLATVRREGDAGAQSYEKALSARSQALLHQGLTVHHIAYTVQTAAEALELVARLNADPAVQGILVFYPLGLGSDDSIVMNTVSPNKDVEGLHAVNLGYLQQYRYVYGDG